MSFWSRLGAAWRELKSGPDGTLALFREVFGRRPSKSGQSVSVTTALEVATFFAGVRVIAEGVAQSPCDLFRDRAGGGKDPATDHELYPILAVQPNETQTTFEFFETLIFHCAVVFNFYAFISRVRGKIDELIPIEPGRVTPRQNADLSITYSVRGLDGKSQDFPQEAIWHVRGPSWNTWVGMDFLRIAREALGLTMAIEADQAQLYKNGLRTSGTYSVEGELTDPQYLQLRKFIKDFQASEEGGPLILDRAAKFVNQTMTGVDAQTIESRKLQIEEICRALRVMPIMVGHAGSTSPTFASAEQFFIAHVVHTLLPWCRRIETSINKNLIGRDAVLKGIKAKFNLNALMRGSFADRQKSFAQMLGLGGSPPYAEINEVRELDDMNPVSWGSGKPAPSSAPAKTDPANPPADNPPKD
jgi:HK97 family phage portal protein